MTSDKRGIRPSANEPTGSSRFQIVAEALPFLRCLSAAVCTVEYVSVAREKLSV